MARCDITKSEYEIRLMIKMKLVKEEDRAIQGLPSNFSRA